MTGGLQRARWRLPGGTAANEALGRVGRQDVLYIQGTRTCRVRIIRGGVCMNIPGIF